MQAPPVGSRAALDLPPTLERAHARQSFLQVLDEAGGRIAESGTAPVASALPRPALGAGPAAADALRSLAVRTLRAETRIDGLIAAAAGGKTFSAGQLLALQATAFRYSQTVEVLSRSADRLVGAIKQMMGTQV